LWAIGFEWYLDMDIHSVINDAKARYSASFLVKSSLVDYEAYGRKEMMPSSKKHTIQLLDV
jgi:hypothetical protein